MFRCIICWKGVHQRNNERTLLCQKQIKAKTKRLLCKREKLSDIITVLMVDSGKTILPLWITFNFKMIMTLCHFYFQNRSPLRQAISLTLFLYIPPGLSWWSSGRKLSLLVTLKVWYRLKKSHTLNLSAILEFKTFTQSQKLSQCHDYSKNSKDAKTAKTLEETRVSKQ